MVESPTYAALLRGVNVGGSNKLAMGDLRALLKRLGYEDVATLLQSGNAVFGAGPGRRGIARRIEETIGAQLGLAVRVLLRTPAKLVRDRRPQPLSRP